METTKMTIHRALSELKTLDARIEKGIADIVPTAIKQKDKKINDYIDEADFNKAVERNFQSVTDLIDRKIKIKAAIVKSNGTTEITIGDKKMTVADAISFKNILINKKQFLAQLQRQHTNTVGVLNKNNEIMKKNIEVLLHNALGKEHTKASKEDIDSISGPYEARNTWTLVDPLKIEDKLKAMEKEITDFELNIDAELSTSNATTTIEI